jgi:spermidine synthase
MPILLAIFFLSGASALAYQIIWIRLFGLVFGGTVISMSVVVAAFMGGLALGSRFIGRYAEKVGNRVRFYGFLEITLGILSLMVFFCIQHLSRLIYILPFGTNSISVAGVMVRLILSGLILIIPTMIMGGTLPVLIRAVTSEKKNIIVNTGFLYAFNALGAMTGAFLVGFVLIRFLGVTWSNLLAVMVNLTLGIIALAVSKRFASAPDSVSKTQQSEKQHGKAIPSDNGIRFIVALTITGFISLSLEMVWLRILLLTINNTIYLYTIVITSILFGLGLGGLLMPFLIPPKFRNEKTFGLILAGLALAILAGFILFPWVSSIGFGSHAFYATWIRLSILTAALVFIMGFVPVFLMGFSLPIGVGLFAREVQGLSRRVGVIYAFNTVGSLAGSLAAVFLLIPLIGMKNALILSSLMVMVPAFYFLWKGKEDHHRFTLLTSTCAIYLLLFITALSVDIPRSILKRVLLPDETIEYLKQGSSSTVWISNRDNYLRKIWIDKLWVSSTSREGTHNLLAHYPVLFHPNPKKVAGIAFGTGQTFGTCLLYPIEKIDCVEIDPEIIKACRGRFTSENFGVLEDPRTKIIIDDGRFYLTGTREKYDIITAEPLQPYTRGTVNLYSREFYDACKRTLLPGGVVAQWLPIYNSGVGDTWSMIRTFAESFNHVLFFLNDKDGIMLGSDGEMHVDASRSLPERAQKDINRIEEDSIYSLAGNFICSREKLLSISKNYPIITDDKPSLEFNAPISHWNEDISGSIKMRQQFLTMIEPIEPLLTGNVNWDLARKFHESRKLIIEGSIMEGTNENESAYKLYMAAYRANPGDIKAIKAMFMLLRKFNRLNLLPPELQYLVKPQRIPSSQ